MIRSNIKGLADALNRLSKRIDLLEKTRRISGGRNIEVKQTASGITINGVQEGRGDADEEDVCTFNFYKFQTGNTADGPEYALRTRAGLLNGVLPYNYSYIMPLKDNDSSVYYIYLEADATTDGIFNVEYKYYRSPQSTQKLYGRHAPPSDIQILCAIVTKGQITNLQCHNINITPVRAFRDDAVFPPVQYYTWQVT